MGLIRKTLRVATLPAGPLGVKGSSKKQRTAKAQLAEAKKTNMILEYGTSDPVEAARIRKAKAEADLARIRLTGQARREVSYARIAVTKAKRHLKQGGCTAADLAEAEANLAEAKEQLQVIKAQR